MLALIFVAEFGKSSSRTHTKTQTTNGSVDTGAEVKRERRIAREIDPSKVITGNFKGKKMSKPEKQLQGVSTRMIISKSDEHQYSSLVRERVSVFQELKIEAVIYRGTGRPSLIQIACYILNKFGDEWLN